MAAEALYTMLGRDRHMRGTFAGAGGLGDLILLLQSHNADVSYCAISILSAFARDAGPDHSIGVDMLRQSGQALTMVCGWQSIICKETIWLLSL